jgi:hypothetical protein
LISPFIGEIAKLAEPYKDKDSKDTIICIPLDEQLKALGVETFMRQSNVININFKNGSMVVVQIDPKKLTNTRDAFEKEALRYPDLSKDTVNKVLLFLMDASNGYLQYLLYNKGEELNGDSHKEASHSKNTSNSTSPSIKENNGNKITTSGGSLSAKLTQSPSTSKSTSDSNYDNNNAKQLSISTHSSQNIVNGKGTSTITAIAYDANTGKKINNAIVKLKIVFTSNGTSKEIVSHSGEITYSVEIQPNSNNSNIRPQFRHLHLDIFLRSNQRHPHRHPQRRRQQRHLIVTHSNDQ